MANLEDFNIASVDADGKRYKKVNGVLMTMDEYNAWKNAGTPSNVRDYRDNLRAETGGKNYEWKGNRVQEVEAPQVPGIPNPTDQYNFDSKGKPIPKDVPHGAEIVDVNHTRIVYKDPETGENIKFQGDFVDLYATQAKDVPNFGDYNDVASPGSGTFKTFNDSGLTNSDEFKKLSEEDQEAVLAVFNAIAGNDKTQAKRLSEAFKAADKINDPYFSQQLRLAVDAIERGYVSIDNEAEFAEAQLATRLADLKEDFQNKKEFLTLEQASTIKEIQRTYEVNLDNLQTNLAAAGFTRSSRRTKKEGLLSEATGALKESTNRKFGFQIEQEQIAAERGERDIHSEIERLKELTAEQKLDFLREAEAKVGTGQLPDLGVGAPSPLGDIQGDIPRQKLQDTVSAATSFVF